VPTWGETLAEIQQQLQTTGGADVDAMRAERLAAVQAHTGRSVISYAADPQHSHPSVQINAEDMIGMMEVFKDLPGPDLDLILYTPGGSAEATDRIVRYIRSKFTHVRVFIPLTAMSAGTMLAMSADEIVMGKHSNLGPIDPQITFNGLTMPAGALTEQFRDAQKECVANPAAITGWMPTLQQYPPGLLNFCESASALSKALVAEWLETYMFASVDDAASKATDVAEWLADDKTHLSHSRAITRDDLVDKGVVVTNLEQDDDPELQDLILSAHHAVVHTFGMGGAMKIIENHLGKRFVKSGGGMVMQGPVGNFPGLPLSFGG
jgi:hypothetical protein